MDQRKLDDQLLVNAQAGEVTACRELLSQGANPVGPAGEFNAMPLHLAVANSRIEVCRLFLDHGAPVDTKSLGTGWTPLTFACQQKDPEIVRLLVERGADVSDVVLLNFAIRGGDMEMCRILIAAGADIHAADENGWSRLHGLAQVTDASAVLQLWSMLNPTTQRLDKPNNFGHTPLYWAAENGNVTLCRLLVEAGANGNFVSERKEDIQRGGLLYGDLSPFQIAARKGHLGVVTLFLETGIDPHWSPISRSRDYQTPFQIAVAQGNVGMVKTICAVAGADFGQRTAKDRPLMGLASKHPEMKVLLRALKTEAAVSEGIADATTFPATSGPEQARTTREFGPL